MYNLSEIKELIKLLNETDIQEIEIENDGARLFIRKPGTAEPVVIQPQTSAPTYMPPSMQASPVVGQAESQPVSESTPAPQPTKEEAEDASLHQIVSPMVGTFYEAPSPTSPPYVKKGDKVDEKTVVCIVEAMKLMNEIEAEVKGEIVEILVENGQLVEYGQPLFLVKQQ